jgi:hypothetical protein
MAVEWISLLVQDIKVLSRPIERDLAIFHRLCRQLPIQNLKFGQEHAISNLLCTYLPVIGLSTISAVADSIKTPFTILFILAVKLPAVKLTSHPPTNAKMKNT